VNSEKKFVIAGLSAGCITMIAIFGYASQGYVRQFSIFWPEEINQTLEFQTQNGHTVVVGKVGNGGTNPELVMRTGGYFYILTVVNKDTVPHQLFVEGPNVSTKLLTPDESDKIILRSKNEVVFNYYDTAKGKEFLGTIRAVKVTAFE
jgi:hypothetical protein